MGAERGRTHWYMYQFGRMGCVSWKPCECSKTAAAATRVIAMAANKTACFANPGCGHVASELECCHHERLHTPQATKQLLPALPHVERAAVSPPAAVVYATH